MAIVLTVLTIVAALRGTWSPCGRSVLSTVTPVAERARGSSFPVTAVAFVAGATVGGAMLGGATAALAGLVDVAGPAAAPRHVAVLALVAVCVAADARIGGLRLPDHPRQVDARWVTRYRPWVYGWGFGVQIGTGVATYVMTNAMYALIAAGALLAGPAGALVLCTLFGLTRGATVLLGAWATTPRRLQALHAGLERTDGTSLVAAMAIQLLVVAVCAAQLPWSAATWVLEAVACALAAACVVRVRAMRPAAALP